MRPSTLFPLLLALSSAMAAGCGAAGEGSSSSTDPLSFPRPPRPRPPPPPTTPLTFSGWSALPSGTTQAADGAVAFQGRLFVFGIGTGDHAHYVNAFDGLTWRGWSLVPGGPASVVADASVVYGGVLHLYGVGMSDRATYEATFDGTTWSAWTKVPGAVATSLPVAATTYEGRIHLFGVGLDARHYVATFDGGGWSAWTQVAGNGTTPTADAAVAYRGKLHLFGLGTDHVPYVNVFDGAAWSGWSAVPGAGSGASPFALSAAVYSGKLQLFAVSQTDGWHRVNAFDGSTWSGWAQVPGAQQAVIASDAAAVFHDQLYVLGVGADGRHYVNVGSDHGVAPTYDQVAFTATHNSYWVKRDDVYEIEATGTQERLLDQALFEGARAFEIDLHSDDSTPGNFVVYHTNLPSNSLCVQLDDCLRELLDFQHALPDHDPFTIVFELADRAGPGPFDDAHTPADLDAIVERNLAPYLFRPRDQLARCPGTPWLRDCTAKVGWPTIDQLRGKFVAAVLGNYDFGIGTCVQLAAHDRKAWVTYAATDAATRSIFPMESPWATPQIACQEGVAQTDVDLAVRNSPFVQWEPGDPTGLAAALAPWTSQHLAVRVDLGGQNDGTIDRQRAIVAAGGTLMQNDHPWLSIANAPLRVATPIAPVPSLDALNEPGHRILMTALRDGAYQGAPLVFAPGTSSRWETTVSDTRPATDPSVSSDPAMPNPRRARGEGCLYASTPTDASGNAANGMRVCRTTASGAWNVSKPLGEDAVIEVTITTNGSPVTSTYYSDDRDPNGPGEQLRLDVGVGTKGAPCAYAFASERTVNDVPQWIPIGLGCFPGASLTEQGIAAKNGDVLFVGTKVAYGVQPREPFVATDDYEPADAIGAGYAITNLTWPRATPAPSCTPDLAGGCAVPVHRAYQASAGHFYTTDIREAASFGFTVESPSYFYVETASATNRAPLHRCYEPTSNRHFYTLDAACEGFGALEQTLGYVATSPLPGTVPLHRSYSASRSDHLYSLDEAEATTAAGYAYESVVGYVWPPSGLAYSGPPIQ